MYKLVYRNGLLYADIEISQGDRTVRIDNVIVDTGCCHTIIITDYLEEIDVELVDDDEIIKAIGFGGVQFSAVRKKIEQIRLGDLVVDNMKIDFGIIDPNDRINGLLGLDFLLAIKAKINLDTLTIDK